MKVRARLAISASQDKWGQTKLICGTHWEQAISTATPSPHNYKQETKQKNMVSEEDTDGLQQQNGVHTASSRKLWSNLTAIHDPTALTRAPTEGSSEHGR